MNKIGLYTILQPLDWKIVDKMAPPINPEATGEIETIRCIRALNIRLSENETSYYQIVRGIIGRPSKLNIVIVKDNGEEYELETFAETRGDIGDLMELAEKDRVKNINSLAYRTTSQAEILEDMIPPLNWKDVELPAMSGLKSCMYAKILSLSKDGELYFLISQGATGRYYLELKCCLDSEDTVKEVIYTDDDLEMVKDFAKRYRLYQVAKSLTGG
jgi:hypothetical protein|nr:MAG TPA: hypothetical protein [Bacteriophage sp.]